MNSLFKISRASRRTLDEKELNTQHHAMREITSVIIP
jgi:hypothetical protein